MSEIKRINIFDSILLWFLRLTYVVVAITIGFRSMSLVLYAINFFGGDIIAGVGFAVNIAFIVFMLIQFSYVFLRKEGKIKGIVPYVVLALMSIAHHYYSSDQSYKYQIANPGDDINMISPSIVYFFFTVTSIIVSVYLIMIVLYSIRRSMLLKSAGVDFKTEDIKKTDTIAATRIWFVILIGLIFFRFYVEINLAEENDRVLSLLYSGVIWTNVLYLISMVIQAPYIFSKKKRQIKACFLFLVTLVLHFSYSLLDFIFNWSLSKRFGIASFLYGRDFAVKLLPDLIIIVLFAVYLMLVYKVSKSKVLTSEQQNESH